MTEHWNNKGRIIFSVVLIVFCSMLLALCFILPDKANSGPYTISAHGQSYGVNRSSLSTFGYVTGNCAHCHEQHASIGGAEPAPNSPAGPDNYLLFMDLWVAPIQTNLFCYGCHIENNSYQSGGILNNYSYSYRAGGDTSITCPDSIYESFQFVTDTCIRQPNCGSSVGSSHMLKNIRDYITSKWNFPGTNTYVNPCSGCHNPHRAQREWAVSRPSQHSLDNNAWGLWGDESGEKMSAYTTKYQPPNKFGGGTERDADTQPDYVTFCLDCHGTIQNSQCYTTVQAVNWTTIDHGKGNTLGGWDFGDLKAPYNNTLHDYVLNCTDCHEPHGSSNEFLLRITVNGSSGLQITGNPVTDGGKWYYWCQACHDVTKHMVIWPDAHCTSCHTHNGSYPI